MIEKPTTPAPSGSSDVFRVGGPDDSRSCAETTRVGGPDDSRSHTETTRVGGPDDSRETIDPDKSLNAAAAHQS